MLNIGMLAFSSSALLFRYNLRPPNLAPKPQIGRRHDGHVKDLCVITAGIDTSADSSMEASDNCLLGGKKDDDNNDTKNILTFQSSFKRQSNPLAQLSPSTNLDEFLLNTDYILNAGKSMHSKIVPKTNELFEEWTIACDRVGACPPNLDHGVIMTVRTAGISIPGLTVEWSALIGTNLVYRSQRHQTQQHYPELEFVLIKDESKVSSGAKPIVWIYNKLTRNKNSTSMGRSKRRVSNLDTKLFTRLGFYKERSSPTIRSSQDNGTNESSFVIRCAGTIEMKFRIPTVLGKLIFSSDGDAQKKRKRNER